MLAYGTRDAPSLFSAIVALVIRAKRSHSHVVPNEVNAREDSESFAGVHFWSSVFLFFSGRGVQHLLHSAFYAFPFHLASFMSLSI